MKSIITVGKSRITVNRTLDGHDCRVEKVRARSDRHAQRLAAMLNWSSRYGGAGRYFAEVYYVPGYLMRRQGMDV